LRDSNPSAATSPLAVVAADVVDVVGSLCENNDKFAIDRSLSFVGGNVADGAEAGAMRAAQLVRPGDLAVVHDTGAHGHSMGFNYNGKLRAAEVLWSAQAARRRTRVPGGSLDASWRCIRRAETYDDLFATLDYPRLHSRL
jgi:diaminopimelate decarboxylase